MAPLAFYMEQKFRPDATAFVDFLKNYGDHTITDDVWLNISWTLDKKEKNDLYSTLSKRSFKPRTKLGGCRIDLIRGMIAYELADYNRALKDLKESARCTQKSDFHKDVQRYFVYALQHTTQFDKAADRILKFEQLYPDEREFSLSQWDGLSYTATYHDRQSWDDPWFTSCKHSALKWNSIYYERCLNLYGSSYCDNGKLRYQGCQYVLKQRSARDIYSREDSNTLILDYLTLANFTKSATDYAFFRSKLNIQDLDSWERDILDELEQNAP